MLALLILATSAKAEADAKSDPEADPDAVADPDPEAVLDEISERISLFSPRRAYRRPMYKLPPPRPASPSRPRSSLRSELRPGSKRPRRVVIKKRLGPAGPYYTRPHAGLPKRHQDQPRLRRPQTQRPPRKSVSSSATSKYPGSGSLPPKTSVPVKSKSKLPPATKKLKPYPSTLTPTEPKLKQKPKKYLSTTSSSKLVKNKNPNKSSHTISLLNTDPELAFRKSPEERPTYVKVTSAKAQPPKIVRKAPPKAVYKRKPQPSQPQYYPAGPGGYSGERDYARPLRIKASSRPETATKAKRPNPSVINQKWNEVLHRQGQLEERLFFGGGRGRRRPHRRPRPNR